MSAAVYFLEFKQFSVQLASLSIQLTRAYFPVIMTTLQFSAEFAQALENAKNVPPLEGFQNCLEVANKHNMTYTFEGTADNFLVHPENRSRLMLTPMKSHKVGEQVHFAGADPKLIDAAYAFEISKDVKRREYQIKKKLAACGEGWRPHDKGQWQRTVYNRWHLALYPVQQACHECWQNSNESPPRQGWQD